jgi:hypothetical protein
VTVGAAGRSGALYSLAQGSSAADALTLSLPASGPDVSADGLSASLKKLAINEARQAGELAHADDVQLRGAKVRLAERRLDLGSLALAGGAAQVRFDKDGSLNWTGPATPASVTDAARQPDQKSAARPARSARPAEPGNAPAAAPWRVTASKLSLREFSLAYADARQEPPLAFRVDDIAAAMSEFDTGAAGPARLQVSGRSGGGTLQAEGSIGLSSGAGDLGIRAAGLPLSMLQPYLTEAARLALTGGTLSGAGRLRFGDAAGPKLTYTGTASLDKVAIEETAPRRHFMSWDAVAASDMRLTLSPNRLEIGQLRIAGPVGELIIAEDQSVNLARVLKRKPEAAGQAAAAKGGSAPAAPGQEGRLPGIHCPAAGRARRADLCRLQPAAAVQHPHAPSAGRDDRPVQRARKPCPAAVQCGHRRLWRRPHRGQHESVQAGLCHRCAHELPQCRPVRAHALRGALCRLSRQRRYAVDGPALPGQGEPAGGG